MRHRPGKPQDAMDCGGRRRIANRVCRQRWRLPVASLLALLLSSALFSLPVRAAEQEGGGWGIWESIGRFFNLFLLVGVLVYFVRKPLSAFFQNRRKELQRQLTDADRHQREAAQKAHEIEERVRRIEQDLVAIREKSSHEIVAEGKRVEESARLESEKILSVAHREIDGILKNAQKELRRYAGSLSVDLAEGMIRKDVNSGDHERIFDGCVREVENLKP